MTPYAAHQTYAQTYARSETTTQSYGFEGQNTLSHLSQRKRVYVPPYPSLSLSSTHIHICKSSVSSESLKQAKNNHPYAALPLQNHRLTLQTTSLETGDR